MMDCDLLVRISICHQPCSALGVARYLFGLKYNLMRYGGGIGGRLGETYTCRPVRHDIREANA